MSTHVMIDLETLSTHNFAAILSIGACKFDPQSRTIDEKFHVYVDPRSCEQYGLRISADTFLWWMDPDRTEARTRMFAHKDERVDLTEALLGFSQWYGQTPMPTWGNGSDFDNVILQNAYMMTKLDCPWKFRDNRCFRTYKSLISFRPPRSGVPHDALEDAVYQAETLQFITHHLGIVL